MSWQKANFITLNIVSLTNKTLITLITVAIYTKSKAKKFTSGY